MFFQRMLPLLGLCQALNITVSQEGELISLVVTPMPNAKSPEGLRVQQILKGTAQEIDEGLAEFLASTTLGVKSIQDQLAENEANIQAEKKRIAEEAKSKVKPKGKAAVGTTVASTDDDNDDESDDDDKTETKATPVPPTSVIESAPDSLFPPNLFGDD